MTLREIFFSLGLLIVLLFLAAVFWLLRREWRRIFGERLEKYERRESEEGR